MKCRIKRSIWKSTGDVKNTDFLTTQYNKPLARYKKNQNSKLEIE